MSIKVGDTADCPDCGRQYTLSDGDGWLGYLVWSDDEGQSHVDECVCGEMLPSLPVIA